MTRLQGRFTIPRTTRAHGVLERAGQLAGGLMAPPVGAGAAARRARLLHPSGVVLRARVTPRTGGDPALARAAERLCGHAVVRFSGALWKRGDRWPDVLGLAIRLCPPGRELEPSPDDQDLLLASLRSPFTLAFAPFLTRPGDFASSTYYGASPFRVDGLEGRVKLRGRWIAASAAAGNTRADRLRDRVSQAEARVELGLRRSLRRAWEPLAEVALLEEVAVPQDALRFDPFLGGRGLSPVGFIHALRRVAYPASRAGSRHPFGRSAHRHAE